MQHWLPPHSLDVNMWLIQLRDIIMLELSTARVNLPQMSSVKIWTIAAEKISKLSRFRVPSRLPLLSCDFGSSWSGQSVPIVQQEFSPTCRSFPRSLICPYVLLLVVSRLFCPCSCLHVTLLSLPVPLLPCAAGLIARRSSSSCGPQTLLAGAGISSS